MTKIAPIVMAWREADVISPQDGTVEKRRVMVPVERYRLHAERQYQDGAEYPLIPLEARSRAAHSRYFAALNEAYGNLPETISKRWETSEHFRKWVLIEVGEFYEKEFEFIGVDAERQARRLAAFIRTEDEFARIFVTCVEAGSFREDDAADAAVAIWNRDAQSRALTDRMKRVVSTVLRLYRDGGASQKWKVLVRKAKSQDHASMSKSEFKESSDKVLAYAEALIGTPRGTMMREAGRSA
jgi:hypothetical protein